MARALGLAALLVGLASLAGLLAARPARAATAYSAEEIDVNPGPAGSDPQSLTMLGNKALFLADDGGGAGEELHSYDLTTQLVALVKDITPGAGGSFSFGDPMTQLGDELLFEAIGGTHPAIWKSDGTPGGTVPLCESCAKTNFFSEPTRSGSWVYYATEGASDWELWRTDGTAAGTMPIPGAGAVPNAEIADLDGSGTVLYTPAIGRHLDLYASDGTAAGTRPVFTFSEPDNDFVADVTSIGAGRAVFADHNSNSSGSFISTPLYVTDGTEAGTEKLREFEEVLIESVVRLGNGALFAAKETATGHFELWKTDGTPAGTSLVKDINPSGNGWVGEHDSERAAVGGQLFFVGEDGEHGHELWRSDGTAAGTRMVADINPGAAGSEPDQLAAVGGKLYFAAGDGRFGRELWTSDGTAAGTFRVADIAPGGVGSGPEEIVDAGGWPLLRANSGSGAELWRAGAPSFQPSPAALDFGGHQIGAAAAGRVTVTNRGAISGRILSSSVSGLGAADFQLGAPSCAAAGMTVAVGRTCSFPVTFRPSGAGPHAASLTLQTDGLAGEVEVPLRGAGLAPPPPAAHNARPPSPPHTTPPPLRLKLTKPRATLGSLRVRARCNRACKVVARVVLKRPKVRYGQAAKRLGAGRAKTLKLKPANARQRRILRRALSRRGKLRPKLIVLASSRGERAARRLTLTLRAAGHGGHRGR